MNIRHPILRLSVLLATGLTACSGASAHCYEEAAQLANISPLLVKAIAKTESGFNPNALNVNSNGTVDVGPMQINSSHLSWLKRYGVTAENLRRDACLNVKIGALILAKNIAQYGQNWMAIGGYNVGCRNLSEMECRHRRSLYAWKVYRNYQLLAQQS